MTTLVNLPPYLLDKIRTLVDADIEIPQDLRLSLSSASRDATDLKLTIDDPAISTLSEAKDFSHAESLPTIDIEILQRLSRWVFSDEGLENASQFSLVALLSGTQVHLAAKQYALLLSAENVDTPSPYLPAYMSPALPTFVQEYRSIAKQLATILNVLFSIFGSSAAVYVVAVTGAGYSREMAMILAILAGALVGVADMAVVWIYVERLERGRRDAQRKSAELAKGSGEVDIGVDEVQERQERSDECEKEPQSEMMDDKEVPAKRQVRLRRRGLGNGIRYE
ncbi:MAG: hypothetical protein TREMPRED_002687 [Tremellales sp. Tagirdzhanova-0007]|nr:MAG: hypothetical protein TREMPRED_002687 [Tremellales sp. Tagirdzhanova-0007]